MKFVQELPKFVFVASEFEFKPYNPDYGYVSSRKMEVVIKTWALGHSMEIVIKDTMNDIKEGYYEKKIFSKNIKDNDFDNWTDKNTLAALAREEIRGFYAESLIHDFVIKYGKDVIKEYFPLVITNQYPLFLKDDIEEN